MNGQREWELLKKIGFVRMGGTEEEKKAAEILKEEVESIGFQAKLQPFEVAMHNCTKVVLKTENRIIEATGYGHCANTDDNGVSAGFYYMQDKSEIDIHQAQGKIVLVNGYMGFDLYKAIIEAKAVGFITYSGELRDKIEETDLPNRELRPLLTDLGKIPGVHIKVQDAMELVNENPESITMIVQQEESTANSHNVICDIKGIEYPNEVIVLTAHFDSVEFSTGVYDNGAGSVILMELLRHFKANPPKRSLRFIWCGSEERGLLGSHAYVNQCKDELKEIRFVLNVDVAGPVLGQDHIFVMAENNLMHYVQYLAKEVGFSALIEQKIYSSDAIPFADQGIPGINFTRFGVAGTAYIHNRHDTLAFMSPESLKKTSDFILTFADRMINACVFPITRKVPDEVVKMVDDYLKHTQKRSNKE